MTPGLLLLMLLAAPILAVVVVPLAGGLSWSCDDDRVGYLRSPDSFLFFVDDRVSACEALVFYMANGCLDFESLSEEWGNIGREYCSRQFKFSADLDRDAISGRRSEEVPEPRIPLFFPGREKHTSTFPSTGNKLSLERGSAWSEARPGARLGLERSSAWSGERPPTRPHAAGLARSSSPAPAAKHATRVTMFQLGHVKPSVSIFARKPLSTNGWGEGSSRRLDAYVPAVNCISTRKREYGFRHAV
ncbi:hypothetical protein KSP40_PGU005782 [Platanthera guangdongensis]|uniref:Uncharacterized protein n=1 Tax=Platanthera guangdongensis TaxID=2320717 RepID=A0ABR2M428_9ASPA